MLELEDRFGPVPSSVEILIDSFIIKYIASSVGVTLLDIKSNGFIIYFLVEYWESLVLKLLNFIETFSVDFEYNYKYNNNNVSFTFKNLSQKKSYKPVLFFLNKLKDLN